MFPKRRYMFYIIGLNCLLVPFMVKYWNFLKISKDTKSFTITSSKRQNLKRGPDPKITPHQTYGGGNKRTCKPKKNVVFLKTHKTGGSTITNILNRYGEAHDLTFVLPRVGENRLDWPWFFQENSFYPLNGSEPNILCNHARLNEKTMNELMPNDTVFVTILRDPISQFESSFSYMTLDKILGMKNSSNNLEEFFKNPDKVLVNYVLTQDLRINSDRLKLIRNGMFYDLGLESKDFTNAKKIKERIAKIDKQFHLVMMMEYFDESIVLLKRLLCWQLDDVVYFSLKRRAEHWRRNLKPTLKNKISNWSRADVMLYQHFNKTFWNILKHIDRDFWDEVRLLKAKNDFMSDLCLQKTGHHHSAELTQTAETEQFRIRYDIPWIARNMCKRMVWDEIKYLKHLREKHIDKINHKYRNNRVQNTIYESISWIAKKLYE